jgi:hypothetical protein
MIKMYRGVYMGVYGYTWETNLNYFNVYIKCMYKEKSRLGYLT